MVTTPLDTAMASTTIGTTTVSTGRKISVKSRIKRAQSLTVVAKLKGWPTISAWRRRSSNTDVLGSPADTVTEHLVYACAQRLLLDADDGPVIREHPRTTARREVRVRRRAENGARDTRHGRQRDASKQQLDLEPEDRRVFIAEITQVVSAR